MRQIIIIVIIDFIESLADISQIFVFLQAAFCTLSRSLSSYASQKKYEAALEHHSSLATSLSASLDESNLLFESLVQRAFRGDL